MMPPTLDPAAARLEKLQLARAADSQAKQQRAIAAVARLESRGDPVRFTDVARLAAVSTWFTYHNTAVAGAVRQAQAGQAEHGRHPAPSPAERVTAGSLRADLEHARHEVKSLREENGRLRHTLGLQLGAELEQTSPAELLDRVRDLETRNTDLTHRLADSTDQNRHLADRLTAAEEDVTAARESLRRAIRAVPSR